MTAPMAIYDSALRCAAAGEDGRVDLVDRAGEAVTQLDTAEWTGGLRPGDNAMLDRCLGSTLDVGCGPGRLAAALRRSGRTALGVDICPEAVRQARRRGAQAMRGNVFAPLPREGEWSSVLLADGSIGIGGDPHRLLRRCAGLVRHGGAVLVELHPPGQASWSAQVRLRHGSRVSKPFPWAAVAADHAPDVAHRVGLRVHTLWTEAGRWFSHLVL